MKKKRSISFRFILPLFSHTCLTIFFVLIFKLSSEICSTNKTLCFPLPSFGSVEDVTTKPRTRSCVLEISLYERSTNDNYILIIDCTRGKKKYTYKQIKMIITLIVCNSNSTPTFRGRPMVVVEFFCWVWYSTNAVMSLQRLFPFLLTNNLSTFISSYFLGIKSRLTLG